MATSVITTCDFIRPGTKKSHGVPATTRVETFLNSKTYEGDLCDECVPEFQRALTQLGIRPSIALVDGKQRGAYVTSSGRAFTTAEAREWLLENGYNVTAHGRISRALLEEFAEAH